MLNIDLQILLDFIKKVLAEAKSFFSHPPDALLESKHTTVSFRRLSRSDKRVEAAPELLYVVVPGPRAKNVSMAPHR